MSGMLAPPAPDEPITAVELASAICDVLSTSGDERIESAEECDGSPPYIVIRARGGGLFRVTIGKLRSR